MEYQEVQLTDEQRQELKEKFDEVSAYRETIKNLSKTAYQRQDEAWGLMKKWYPDLSNDYKWDGELLYHMH